MTNIVFDWKRTLYEPEEDELIGGALELLEWLGSQEIPTVLIGKGDTDMYGKVDRLGVRQYFSQVIFREGAKIQIYLPFLSTRLMLSKQSSSVTVYAQSLRLEMCLALQRFG